MRIDDGVLIDQLWAWGWEPPAALVSFSAVLVMGGKVVDVREWRFDLRDQLCAGASVERLMSDWWDDRVREGHYLAELLAPGPKARIADAAQIVNDFKALLPFGAGVYFGNASQDAPLLRAAMLRAGVVPVWNISDQLCLNTMERYHV